MVGILENIVILIILNLAMTSNKLKFFGNVLLYAILATLFNVIGGGAGSLLAIIIVFIIYLIFGFILVFLLNIINSYGDWKLFVIIGLILSFIISFVFSFVASLIFG